MARRLREAVRGIVVDHDHRVLLVKYIFPSGAERWIRTIPQVSLRS